MHLQRAKATRVLLAATTEYQNQSAVQQTERFGKYTGPEAEQGIQTSASSGRPVKQRCAVHVYGEKKCKSLSLGEQSGFELLSKPTPDYLVRRYQTASPFNFIACGCIQSTLCANEVLFGRNDSCARGRGRHRGPAAIPAEPSTS